MWSSQSGSSSNHETLSEYERQRLENIAQLSLEFKDLFDDATIAAHNLANSSRAAATKSNATRKVNKRNTNTQQWHQVKMMSKEPVRRSKRLINGERKKLNYDEQSDSEGEPSKIRLKFPFFKKSEYSERDEDYYRKLDDADFIDSDEEFMELDESSNRSKRNRQISSNHHQIPVSLITKEMLKEITYSSCGKIYDPVNGTTCHQCRQKTRDQKSYCRYKKCRGIRGMFCGFCLGKRYGEDVAEVLLNKKWACPPCRGYCNCSICRRKRGRSPTGQLAQVAQAGGYKSVKHLLETTEGGAPEKNLSSDYDSDDEEKIDQENDISQSSNNNLNDDEVQDNDVPSVKKIKTDHLYKEAIKTENQNLLKDVNCNSDGRKPGSIQNLISDDEKDNQKDGVSGDTNLKNVVNDNKIKKKNVVPKKKTKTDDLNEEGSKTEQINDNEKQSSLNNMHMNSEMILDKIYSQLYCSQEAQ